VEADIDVVGGPDQLVRQPRPAARAEDDPGRPEGLVDLLPPPARVPELDDVAPPRLELAHDRRQPLRRIVEARRQLEQQASHVRPEQVGDMAEVTHQPLRPHEAPRMGD
jgi:hypothetical protein